MVYFKVSDKKNIISANLNFIAVPKLLDNWQALPVATHRLKAINARNGRFGAHLRKLNYLLAYLI